MNKKRKKYRKETKKGKRRRRSGKAHLVVNENPDYEWSVGNE